MDNPVKSRYCNVGAVVVEVHRRRGRIRRKVCDESICIVPKSKLERIQEKQWVGWMMTAIMMSAVLDSFLRFAVEKWG
jgi:hypothetical protein